MPLIRYHQHRWWAFLAFAMWSAVATSKANPPAELHLHFGYVDTLPGRWMTTRFQPGVPVFVASGETGLLTGIVVEGDNQFVVDVSGEVGGSSRYHKGRVALEEPFFSQGGGFSGFIVEYWFCISTNSDPAPTLENLELVLRSRLEAGGQQKRLEGERSENPTGKPLGDWVTDVNPDTGLLRVQAREAIRRIVRTNQLSAWAKRLGGTDEAQRKAAYRVFEAFGPSAQAAVPALEKLLQDRATAGSAASILVHNIGPVGWLPVAEALNHRDPLIRLAICESLSPETPEDEDAVGWLVLFLKKGSADTQIAAASALPRYGEFALEAMPVLSELMAAPNVDVRIASTNVFNYLEWVDRNRGKSRPTPEGM